MKGNLTSTAHDFSHQNGFIGSIATIPPYAIQIVDRLKKRKLVNVTQPITFCLFRASDHSTMFRDRLSLQACNARV